MQKAKPCKPRILEDFLSKTSIETQQTFTHGLQRSAGKLRPQNQGTLANNVLQHCLLLPIHKFVYCKK